MRIRFHLQTGAGAKAASVKHLPFFAHIFPGHDAGAAPAGYSAGSGYGHNNQPPNVRRALPHLPDKTPQGAGRSPYKHPNFGIWTTHLPRTPNGSGAAQWPAQPFYIYF